MPDLDQKLWGEVPQWPSAPLNFVFVVDAIQRLGRAKYRDAWLTIVIKQGKEFDGILKTLGEACEAGTVDAFYEWGIGTLDQIKRTDWHVPNWRSFFYRGWLYATEEYEAEMDSFAAIEAGPPPPQTKPCWIFVRATGLAQLEARLDASSRSKEGAKPKGKPIKASKRSMDEPHPGRRGPKKGASRFADADRALLPDLKRIMHEKHLAAHGAALELVKQIAGAGTPESKAKRLAALYLNENKLKLPETN